MLKSKSFSSYGWLDVVAVLAKIFYLENLRQKWYVRFPIVHVRQFLKSDCYVLSDMFIWWWGLLGRAIKIRYALVTLQLPKDVSIIHKNTSCEMLFKCWAILYSTSVIRITNFLECNFLRHMRVFPILPFTYRYNNTGTFFNACNSSSYASKINGFSSPWTWSHKKKHISSS